MRIALLMLREILSSPQSCRIDRRRTFRPCIPARSGVAAEQAAAPPSRRRTFRYSSATVKNKKMTSKPMVAKIKGTNSVMIAVSKTEA